MNSLCFVVLHDVVGCRVADVLLPFLVYFPQSTMLHIHDGEDSG